MGGPYAIRPRQAALTAGQWFPGAGVTEIPLSISAQFLVRPAGRRHGLARPYARPIN